MERPGLFPVDVDITTSAVITLQWAAHDMATVYFTEADPGDLASVRPPEEIPLERGHPNRRLLDELERRLPLLADRPHLVIWGLQDRVFHRGFLDGWRERFPAARVHAFEDASHWVVDEAPERIVALMGDFLAGTE